MCDLSVEFQPEKVQALYCVFREQILRTKLDLLVCEFGGLSERLTI
jgi:hypothetical protein